jgi:hypothetical protein
LGSAAGGQSFTTVSRKYTRAGDKLEVAITLTNSPQFVEGARQGIEVLKNPAMLQMLNQDEKMKIEILEKDGWFGTLVVNKGSSAEASVYSKDCLLSIRVGKDDAQVLKTFWNAVDLKAASGAGTTSRPAANSGASPRIPGPPI